MSDDINSMFLSLEKELLDPTISHEQRRTLIHEDFLEFGKSGAIWHKDSILEYLRTSDAIRLAKTQFLELSARELVPGTVLVTYRTRIESDASSGALRSSIWMKRADAWQIRFHQATPSQATLGS